MKGSGDYSDRCQWLKRATTTDPANGQAVESWPANGYLWCSVEPNSGRRQEAYGADRPGTSATIRVRNWPALSALDRLYDGEWGETWVIETVMRGDNELVVQAHQFDGGPPA